MRSTQIILASAVLAILAGTAIYLTVGRPSEKPAVDLPVHEHGANVAQPEVVPVETPPRLPITTVEPEPEVPAAPVVPELVIAPAPTVGDRTSWPAEYADKPLSELIADEARLRQEAKADLDAEVERRFQDGRYESYPQGGQPTNRVTRGILVGRGDATTIRFVEIDRLAEPQFFIKEEKAGWLLGEIKRRGQ